MHYNNINEDLRIVRTERALYEAMFSLLKKQKFVKTTVKEICEEALISRAAFYAHFIDKYDLLKQWLMRVWSQNFSSGATYEQIEKTVNQFMNENKRVLKNLIREADNETFEVLFDFIVSVKKLTIDKNSSKELYCKNVALSNFYAGGIISYLLWQIKNEFPAGVPIINKEIFKLINDFRSDGSSKPEHSDNSIKPADSDSSSKSEHSDGSNKLE